MLFEKRILRAVFGPKWAEVRGDWSCWSPNVFWVAKWRTNELVGHVARLGKNINACKILVDRFLDLSLDVVIILNGYWRNSVERHGLDLFGSGCGQMGRCKYGNEYSCLHKQQSIYWPGWTCQLLKKNPAAWIHLVTTVQIHCFLWVWLSAWTYRWTSSQGNLVSEWWLHCFAVTLKSFYVLWNRQDGHTK